MTQTVFDVVADFGADPTGAASSDAAFKAWALALRSCGRQPPMGAGSLGGVGLIPNGTYVGLTSYDFTKCNGIVIKSEGTYQSVLYADGQTVSQPVFDFTGSNAIKVEGVNIYAMHPDGTRPPGIPSTAFLIAASAALNDSNKNRLQDCGVIGWFSSAPLCVIGSTDNIFDGVTLTQQEPGLPALNHSGNPDWYISSPYTPIEPGGQPCGENSFFQCEAHGRNQNGSTWTVYFRDAYSTRFYGGNVSANGGRAQMLFQGHCRRIRLDGVQFWTETAPPQFVLEDQGSGTEVLAIGCDPGAFASARSTGPFSGGLAWS